MKWFDEQITWTEANEKCQSFGAYLPTFIDDDTGKDLEILAMKLIRNKMSY